MGKVISNFFTWVSKSFSGSDDVSSRRLSAFQVMQIYTVASVFYMLNVKDAYYLLLSLVLHASLLLLLFGIITIKDVIQLKNGKPTEG